MLDLYQVTAQFDQLLKLQKEATEAGSNGFQALELALARACNEPDSFRSLLDKCWNDNRRLYARPFGESLDLVRDIALAPSEHQLLAVDGSQSLPRFRGLDCFLINLGIVRLRMGMGANASIESSPRLIHFSQLKLGDRDRLEEVISLERTLAEFGELARSATLLERDAVRLALIDGGLTFWYLMQGGSQRHSEAMLMLTDAILPQFRKLSQPLAGYISGSSGKELVNALSLLADGSIDPGFLTDRMLWETRLRPGQRGPLLESNSEVLGKYQPDDAPVFCFLNIGTEAARVEIPRWCAPRVDEILSLILDTTGKGDDYPVPLIEAHHAAVVTNRDTEAMWELLATKAGKLDIMVDVRPKDRSKRRAGI